MFLFNHLSLLSRSLLPTAIVILLVSGCNLQDPNLQDPNAISTPSPDADDQDISDAENSQSPDSADDEVEPAPTCEDGMLNGDETDIDCGGPECEPCQEGLACLEAGDCASTFCVDSYCATCDPAATPFGAGEGTEASPFMLCSPSHLEEIASSPGSHFQLADDIDLTDISFAPIGSADAPFTGVLNGADFEIQNFTILSPASDDLGFFYSIGPDALIKNLKFTAATLKGEAHLGVLAVENQGTLSNIHIDGEIIGSLNYIGGLVGTNSGAIEDSSARVQITGDQYIGGLVGYNNGPITNSSASGDLFGRLSTGGLVGESAGGAISDSFATGEISGDRFIGGLVGYNGSTIVNSYATGEVTGDMYTGGLVGNNRFRRIENSYATGQVSGDSATGGLVGMNYKGIIESSYATGQISGDSGTGGLVGTGDDGTISSSYATGQTSGNLYTGGLVGMNSGIIESSFAQGRVMTPQSSDTHHTGGLVGYQNGGSIKNAYATGHVTGSSSTGGLVGILLDGSVHFAYAFGLPYPSGNQQGPLIGYASSQSPVEQVYWNGGNSCQYPEEPNSSFLHGLCLIEIDFLNQENFSSWLDSGPWKMSAAEGRPILSWEEDV